jgi:hypothetical protein
MQKSPKTARRIYELVYSDCYKEFLKGKHTNFADSALRMGNVFAKGIGAEESPTEAYPYYLQADYAARLRAADSNFFGDVTVAIHAQDALEETEAKLPDDYFQSYMDYNYPHQFARLAENGNRCELKRWKDANGNVVLTATRLATKANPNPDDVLFTAPRMQYCERRKDISLTLIGMTDLWFKDNAQSVKYDSCVRRWYDNRYDFYYDDQLVAHVKCAYFRLMPQNGTAPSDVEYRMVGVQFDEFGRIYDYLCDLDDVQVGDQVIVETRNGETEVTVSRIETRKESELRLPMERYKKVIRKV